MADFQFPLAFGFASLPKFQCEDLVSQEVIGQGTFGAVFLVFSS